MRVTKNGIIVPGEDDPAPTILTPGQKLVEPGDDTFDDWLLFRLYDAFLDARKGKRGSEDELKFEVFAMENLMGLRDALLRKEYSPGRGIAFMVFKPVPREIFAAPFRDRVVHHLLYNLSAGWFDRRFIRDSYSCRKGKGTLDGILRLVHHIRSVSRDYSRPAYVAKLDIQSYFTSLNRKKLFEAVDWGISRQFAEYPGLYDLLKFTWGRIIFDDPTKGVRRRGSIHDWDVLPRNKSLFNQPPGQGIVIGNLSSQLLSNIYLDRLDRFVKIDLGYKHYGRYVDDFYIVVTEEELPQMKADLKVIERFLQEELLLTLHPTKRYIQEVSKGVEFLGAVIYPHHIVPTKRFVRNYYETARLVTQGRKELDCAVSYLGHLAHFNGRKLSSRVFDAMGWRFQF